MRKTIFLIAIGLLMMCCKQKKSLERVTAIASQTVSNDTVISVYTYESNILPPVKMDTTVAFGKQKYTLSMSARLDTTLKFEAVTVYNKDNKIHKDIDKGYNGTLSIQLKNEFGGSVFKRILTKNDFLKVDSRSILAASNIEIPTFRGYLSAFDAFLFEIRFGYPDSDVFDSDFFLIKNKGRDLSVYSLDSMVQAGCDGSLELSPDGKTLLACNFILKSDGTTIDISDKRFYQVATRLLNNKNILVVREFSDRQRIPNAFILNMQGKIQKRFVYKGYYSEFAYTLPSYLEKTTNTLFLLDEPAKALRVIPCNNPTGTYLVAFKDMAPVYNARSSSEVEFKLESLETKYFFYLNKATMKLRCNLE